MLILVLYWMIWFVMSYAAGHVWLVWTKIKSEISFSSLMMKVIIGLVFLSWWVNAFSLIIPINGLIGWPSVFFLASLFVFDFGNVRTDCKEEFKTFNWSVYSKLFLLVSTGIYLIKSSKTSEIFDEGAYYLPSIMALENVGLVPGLANLNGHYGLNSAWVSLQTFTGLGLSPTAGGIYKLNGFLAFCFVGYVLYFYQKHQSGMLKALVFAAIILPLLIFRNQLTSASSDIPVILISWFFFLFWLEKAFTEKGISMEDVWILIPVPVFLFTIKTSSAALLLSVPLLLWTLNRLAGMKKTLWATLFCLFLILPWLVQNYKLSGYLVFPYSFTAMGQPDWQVPIEDIQDKFYMAQFQQFAPPAKYSFIWFIKWWAAHNSDTKALLVLAFAGLFAFGFWLKRFLTIDQKWAGFSILLCLLTGWIIWFFTVSEPRYGFSYFPLLAAFGLSIGASFLPQTMKQLCLWLFLGLQVMNLTKSFSESKNIADQLLAPAGYPLVQYRIIEMQNFKALTPVAYLDENFNEKYPFCWQTPFPCFPKEEWGDSSRVVLRGDNWKSGFKTIKKAR